MNTDFLLDVASQAVLQQVMNYTYFGEVCQRCFGARTSAGRQVTLKFLLIHISNVRTVVPDTSAFYLHHQPAVACGSCALSMDEFLVYSIRFPMRKRTCTAFILHSRTSRLPSFQLVSISVPHAASSLVPKNKLHIPPGIDMLSVGLVLHERVVIEGSGR
jgi:hypothetical protein